jgi:glycosyltransferase involved in cell wall biosynthesis
MVKVRALHLAESPDLGGAARGAWRVHQALLGLPQVESVFAAFHSDGSSPDSDSIKLSSGSAVSGNRLMNRLWTLARHFMNPVARSLFDLLLYRNRVLESQVRDISPDIVFVHWVKLRDVPLRTLHKISAPVVIVLHDARYLLGSRAYPVFAELPNRSRVVGVLERIVSSGIRALSPNRVAFVAPSEWLKELAAELGWSPRHRTEVITYPLDVDFWTPAPGPSQLARERQSERDLTLSFGFLGMNAGMRKGQDIFHAGLRQFLGELQRQGRSMSLKVNYFGHARVSGHVPPDRGTQFTEVLYGLCCDVAMRKIFRNTDLVIVPSRVEGLGQVAMEAQACGASVLVAARTGLESTLLPLTGASFDLRTPGSLSQGIQAFLSATDTGGHSSEKVSESVRLRWGPEVVAEKYLALIQSLVAHR